MKKLIVLLSALMISTSVSAAEIPPESLPSNATFECMEYTESLISDILEKVRIIIAPVIEEYKLCRMDYDEATKRAYEKIYQSVDASFDYDTEFAKDTCYRNIPSVDNSLFTIVRKLILAEITLVNGGCCFYM